MTHSWIFFLFFIVWHLILRMTLFLYHAKAVSTSSFSFSIYIFCSFLCCLQSLLPFFFFCIAFRVNSFLSGMALILALHMRILLVLNDAQRIHMFIISAFNWFSYCVNLMLDVDGKYSSKHAYNLLIVLHL